MREDAQNRAGKRLNTGTAGSYNRIKNKEGFVIT
jgi:hypothetical protein